MQRFGRGARDKSLNARALLLVEPRLFDDEVEKAREAVERKRKKAAEHECTLKRGRANSRGESFIGKPKPAAASVVAMRVRREMREDTEVAVRDFVNAENRRGTCRRFIADLYFGNDLIRM